MIFAAVPTPAQLMTPPSGALVLEAHSMVLFTAEATSARTVMSVLKNLTFLEQVNSSGGGERSRIDT